MLLLFAIPLAFWAHPHKKSFRNRLQPCQWTENSELSHHKRCKLRFSFCAITMDHQMPSLARRIIIKKSLNFSFQQTSINDDASVTMEKLNSFSCSNYITILESFRKLYHWKFWMCSMHNRINKLAYCLQQLANVVGVVAAVSKWNEHCNIAYFRKTETINYRMHLHRTVLCTYVRMYVHTYPYVAFIYSPLFAHSRFHFK